MEFASPDTFGVRDPSGLVLGLGVQMNFGAPDDRPRATREGRLANRRVELHITGGDRGGGSQPGSTRWLAIGEPFLQAMCPPEVRPLGFSYPECVAGTSHGLSYADGGTACPAQVLRWGSALRLTQLPVI